MILKGFKEKSNKKYINSRLKNRVVAPNGSKIKTLGVILNTNEVSDFEWFNALAKTLKVNPNNIKIISFSEDKKTENHLWENTFTPKDFGWKGVLKHSDLKTFASTKFDALISFYTEDKLHLKVLTAASEAAFKVGIFQDDERLNDLIIKTEAKDLNTFKTELIKYLNILNKFNNE